MPFQFGLDRYRGVVLAVGLALSACTQAPVSHLLRAQHSAHLVPQRSELTLDDEERANALCPFGIPAKTPGWDHGYTAYAVHAGYAVEYSSDYKLPLWVCERLEPHPNATHHDRTDHFRPDPKLVGPQAALSDFRNSGYARGHQAPAEDFSWNADLQDESFYLSNMSAQLGAFNSGIWRKVETEVRTWSESGHPTWVITGSMLYDPAEDDTQTADGWIPYYVIGSGVAVPTHLFKIVVHEDAQGQLQVAAFVIPNAKPPAGYALTSYLRSVRWIEERTGLDFMPDLPPAQTADLEEPAATVWPP